MAQQKIGSLEPGARNKILDAKVYRKLNANDFPKGAPLTYCCVLLDKEGNSIQVNMDADNVGYFDSILEVALGRSWKVLKVSWKPMKCVRKCWKARKAMEALKSSRSLPEECRIVHKCSSNADLIEIKCRTEDPCRDKSVTSGIRASRFEAMTNEGDKNVGGASGIVVDDSRGREESHQGDKRSRGASRDTVASFAKRMVGFETSMLELKERIEESHQHLEELGSNFAELREDFKSALNILGGNFGREIHEPFQRVDQSSWLLWTVKLHTSTAYHPQSDGQTEVVNRSLECYLRCMCRDKPKEWFNWVSLAEYWYNTSYHTTIKTTPYQVIYGQPPPDHIIYSKRDSLVDVVDRSLYARESAIDLMKFHIKRSQDRMKSLADKHRTDRDFTEGTKAEHRPKTLPQVSSDGLISEEPFAVLEKEFCYSLCVNSVGQDAVQCLRAYPDARVLGDL
ncbi:retrotransposable element Tf2 [Tanacetum coccineum]